MFFSIIIPIYNSEKYVEACLESITNQTFSDFEVVLVNDGSTDASRDICSEFCRRDSRFQIYDKNNGGQFSARKMGIEHAKGKYIVPVDSDDLIRTDALQLLYDFLNKKSVDILIFCGSKDINYEKAIYSLKYNNGEVFSEEKKKELYSYILSKNSLNSFCMKAYNRALLQSVAWDEETIAKLRNGEDMMQLLPVLTKADSVGYSKEILYYYRPNQNSASHRYNPNVYESRKIIYDELLKYSKEWGLYNNVTINALRIRTLRNIVSIIKELKYEDKHIRKKELSKISRDDWGKSIYERANVCDLRLSERVILFFLYHQNILLLSLLFKFGGVF